MSTLLVASSGGHLKQLHALWPRLEGIDDDVTWATFDGPQARSMLAGQDVIYVHDQPPRDYRACMRNAELAARLLRKRRFDTVVSTGAGVALAFLPAAALLGAGCHYIESATRTSGPSLTGKLLRTVPGIRLYTQYRRWRSSRWRYAGSVFDAFAPVGGNPRTIRRAVVTLGTQEGYPFGRLLRGLVDVLPTGIDVLWQTGSTRSDDVRIAATPTLPATRLQAAMAESDLVVAHAGTGSALAALEVGRCPVLVPRRAQLGEHVDDHQSLIAAELHDRGLAITCEPERLSVSTLERAAGRSVLAVNAAAPFRLA